MVRTFQEISATLSDDHQVGALIVRYFFIHDAEARVSADELADWIVSYVGTQSMPAGVRLAYKRAVLGHLSLLSSIGAISVDGHLISLRHNALAMFADTILDANPAERSEQLIGAYQVPAADRLVNLEHNSAAYVEVIKAVDDLVDAIRTSNSLEVDVEERKVLLEEVSTFRRLLDGEKIRAAVVWASTQAWGAIGQFACRVRDDVINSLAQRAASLLRSWLGL